MVEGCGEKSDNYLQHPDLSHRGENVSVNSSGDLYQFAIDLIE